MRFEWDECKARLNEAKHGVGFHEALTVFRDRLALIGTDDKHSDAEVREFIIGQSARQRMLVVIFTERSDAARIISARLATRRECRAYEEESCS